MKEVRETRELSELATFFRDETERFIRETERKRELARALGEEEGVIKEHIKLEVMRAAQQMFRDAYFFTAKVRPWRDREQT